MEVWANKFNLAQAILSPRLGAFVTPTYMATVSLKNVEKIYPGEGKNAAFKAVKSINLEIRDGEFMVLVGPSGCAKSTTLRMIAGLEDISGGDISIDETRVNDLPPKKRDIAMVFQNYALYPHMTVYDNMAFGLKLSKHSKSEIKKRVTEAASILGLEDLLDRRPNALSGGQRQRVAVGRSIVREPKVFLFDEPLSNLDAKMRISMRAEITALHRRLKSTMIYVTHDQTEAMTMGDRITVMNQGEIMQVDTPMELYRNPANQFVAGFIGSPPMNFLTGMIRDGEFVEGDEAVTGGRVQLEKAPSTSDTVTLGVRPEHLSLSAEKIDNGNSIATTVEFIEPMGSETIIHTKSAAGNPIVVKVSGDQKVEINSVYYLTVESARLYLFDASGDRLV